MKLEFDRSKLAALSQKHGLDLVLLFGSQATGRTHPKSDVDIAVLSRQKFDRFKLAADLQDLFRRDDVELVNLGRASPTLMRVVIDEGVVLYEREPEIFFRWKLYAIKIWMETAWLRDLRDRKLLEWAKQPS